MELQDWLWEATGEGKKLVRQIEFEGEQFDVLSVRRWRDRALRGTWISCSGGTRGSICAMRDR